MVHLPRALGQGFAELLFMLPVPLLAALYLLKSDVEAFVWVLTLPFSYVAGTAVGRRYRPSRRIARLLWAAACGIAHSLAALALTGRLSLIALSLIAISAAAAYQGLRFEASRSWQLSFPTAAMTVGIVLHLAGQAAAVPLDRLGRHGAFLTVCGIAAVIAYLFVSNDRLLSGEADGQGRTSAVLASFKRQNRILTGIFVVVIAVIGLFRVWQRMIENAVKDLANAIMAWLSRPGEEAPPEAPPSAPAVPPIAPAEEPQEPAAWLLWLEQAAKIMAIVLAIAAVIALGVIVGRQLYRVLRKWIDALLQRKNDAREQEESFVDEVEHLMTLTKWSEQWRKRLSGIMPGRNAGIAWDKMTASMRIRHLYGSMLQRRVKQGYPYKPYLTPQETAADLQRWKPSGKTDTESALVRLYDDVRYGDAEPPLADTDRLKRLLEEERK